ncbi:MAG: DUF3732 domain-containing protein [Planctomycetota bacterium]|nr:MAG: DUF3732 domain-containing protein [Planctomycetota bacterium]REK20282.1 MAG: DUF3732 domain-containing protein [Planctomycetota bacterium]REK34711.1 MAG: DUF3732 domain-containing protein [Planctomycetota bacterium]
MSFQVRTICVYSHDGRARSIGLRTGELSIVTGKSETGKSALLSILNYCLGSRTYRIPIGTDFAKCSWFGALFVRGTETLFVARPRLPPGQKSHTGVFIKHGVQEVVPYTELAVNANLDTLTSTLASLADIGDAITQPEPGRTTDAISPSIRHARNLILQPQSLIANERQLFYGTDDTFEKLHMRDTLPYFLGAVPEDFARKRMRLREARHELKVLTMADEEREATKRYALRAAAVLVSEARDAGIGVDPLVEQTLSAGQAALRFIADWEELETRATDTDSDELSELQDRFQRMQRESGEIRRKIDAAEAFAVRATAFTEEAGIQDSRLALMELFGDELADELRCPLCGSDVRAERDVLAAVRQSTIRLRQQLEAVSRQRPRLTQHLDGLRNRLSEVERETDNARSAIRAIYRAQSETRAYQQEVLRRAQLSGRAIEVLRGFGEASDGERRDNERRNLEREIARLAQECDTDAIAERMRTIGIAISSKIAAYARNMELAHADSAMSLDLTELELRFVFGLDTVGLERIGAGKNWVGYHVAALLGLHSWLIEHSRPVPRILFFDQVSQPFFSNEMQNNPDRSEDDLTDDDRQQAMRIIRQLHEFCNEYESQFQIILIEHIDSDEDWFRDSVVARWRGSEGLVPNDWPLE